MTPARCRTCGNANVECVGSLPDGQLFAGRHLATALPGGFLRHCRKCGFVFRDPLLGDDTYENLYREGALDVWDSEQRREDFRLIKETINSTVDRPIDILDVGCYTGQLLVSMPKYIRMHGIEASKEAARVATSRGVHIVAGTVGEFAATSGRYDVITACDVIEHVANPLEFLRQLLGHLKPNGRLMITTGNSDAWLWRLSGARFWYCHFPEHISFIGRRWVGTMPQRAGMKLVRYVAFNHEGGTIKPMRVLATSLYLYSPGVYRKVRSMLGKSNVDRTPPGNGATKDHMLCVFEAA